MTTEGQKQTKKIKVKWEAFLKTRFAKVIKEYFGFDDLAALMIMLIGALYYWENGFVPYNQGWRDFYKNIHIELIGIGVTVLIIGNANQYLQIKAEQRRLILQMGSPNNDFAIEAVRQLRQRGWLHDGTTKGAGLRRANLKGATLMEAHLEGANLSGAYLEGTVLLLTHLEGADLYSAHLKGAILWNANLEGATLWYANLEGATLWNANLEGAELRNANLEGAELRYANLEGAELRYAHLEGANLGGATYDKDTKWYGGMFSNETTWPDESFDPKAKGLINIDEPGEQPLTGTGGRKEKDQP